MANNQYINKVVFGDDVLIDLSNDTIIANGLAQGQTAHDHTGAPITGSLQYKSPSIGFNNGRLEVAFDVGIYGGLAHFSTIRIPVPSSGTNSICIKVPNGTASPDTNTDSDWVPVTFTVDTSGDYDITGITTSAETAIEVIRL